jgi:hypothetical protein
VNPQNDNERLHKDFHFRLCPTTGLPLILQRTPVMSETGKFEFSWTTMYMEDFGELLSEGYPPNLWKLYSDEGVAVVEPDLSSYFILAEFIMDTGQGQTVEYIDGDPLNVCRHNLKVVRRPEYRLSIVK